MARFSVRGGGCGGDSGRGGSSNNPSRRRQRSEDEEGDADSRRARIEGDPPFESRSPLPTCSNVRSSRESSLLSVTLDSDVLDCSICCWPLLIPIFQCENGHIACSSCCSNLRNKCPSCSLPIGYNRCRAMEKVLEAIKVPCPNAEYGCPEKFTYASGAHSSHEFNCIFSPCKCPKRSCNFLASHKHLQVHYRTVHMDHHLGFLWDTPFFITLGHNCMEVLQEETDGDEDDGELLVIQHFRNSRGDSMVSMSRIAPPVQGMGEFSYSLAFKSPEGNLRFEPPRMRTIPTVMDSPPDWGFFLIPSYLLNANQPLKLEVCIHRTTRP